MKTIIGIPAHDGKIAVDTAENLILCKDLYGGVIWVKHCCFASLARNSIAKTFLATDADRLLFIDTDIIFDRKQMEALLNHDDADIVAGL